MKVQRNNINKFVLDSVIEFVGKVESRPKQTRITQKVINEGWAKEVEECYNVERRKEELQKTEKHIDRHRREGQEKYIDNI